MTGTRDGSGGSTSAARRTGIGMTPRPTQTGRARDGVMDVREVCAEGADERVGQDRSPQARSQVVR